MVERGTNAFTWPLIVLFISKFKIIISINCRQYDMTGMFALLDILDILFFFSSFYRFSQFDWSIWPHLISNSPPKISNSPLIIFKK